MKTVFQAMADWSKRKLLWIALCFVPLGVAAADLIELAMPNDTQGHIVLTNQPCTQDVKFKGSDKLYAAYGTQYEGKANAKRLEGCWYSPSLEGAPVGAVTLVNILTLDGVVFTYPALEFKPYHPDTL